MPSFGLFKISHLPVDGHSQSRLLSSFPFQVGGSLEDRTGQLVEGSGGQDISASDVAKHVTSENGWI